MAIEFADRSKLSVGFVVSHPFNSSPGSTVRIRELAHALSNLGAICHIYSPFDEKASWGRSVSFHHMNGLALKLGIQNLLYRLTRKVLNRRFLAGQILLNKRALDTIIDRFAKALLATVKFEEVDVIQGEQEIAAAACARVRDKLGVPVIASLHNIWPEELVAMGIINKSSEQYVALEEIEREIIRDSETIVVVSEEMARYLEQRYFVGKDHILVVPPGGRPRVSKVGIQVNAPPFKVVHAGLVVHRAHVDLLVESIPAIIEKCSEAEFFISRKGENLQRICRLAKKLGVNPNYYWYPSSVEFYEFLASCSVGVLPSSNDIARRIGPALKLFDYLSVGLPVVANDIGGWVRIIEEEKVGILTDDDPKSFAEGILELLRNKTLSYECGKRGIELVTSKRNWNHSAKKLLQKYQQLL